MSRSAFIEKTAVCNGMYLRLALSALLFLTGALHCSPSLGKGNGDTDADGDADGGVDGDIDGDADSEGDDDDADDLCSEQSFDVAIVPTRVMLLLDRSSSMSEQNPPKWIQARDAITTMLGSWVGNDGIEFGLDVFPNAEIDACAAHAPVIVDTAPGSTQSIIDLLEATDESFPDGATPLCAAMNNFDIEHMPDYAPLFGQQNANRYLVVLSDGQDTCGDSDGGDYPYCGFFDELVRVTSRLLETGVRSYAIGLNVGTVGAYLDEIAANGGTDRTSFIPAEDGEQLQEVLGGVAEGVVSCSFELAPEGAVDWDEVNVYVDGVVLPYDEGCAAGVGWDWESDNRTRVVLCEEPCTSLREGLIDAVSATIGCPTESVY